MIRNARYTTVDRIVPDPDVMYAVYIRHTCLRNYYSSGHFSSVGLWYEFDFPIGVSVGPQVTADASHMLQKVLRVTLVILHVLSRAVSKHTWPTG